MFIFRHTGCSAASPILQRPIRDDPRGAFPTLCLPACYPVGNFSTARGALNIHRRDDARPVEGKGETREFEERTVF